MASRLTRDATRNRLRSMTSGELHGLAGSLLQRFWHDAISPRQDWLLDAALRELGYRSRRAKPGERCVCSMCFGPFDDGLQGDPEV